MRPVRKPEGRTPTSAACCPIAGRASGSTRWSGAGPAGADFSALLSLKDYPDATSPGLLDAMPAAAVRDGRQRELRPAGAADRARADGPRAAPAALGRRRSGCRAGRDARRARRARHRLDRLRRPPPDRAGQRARPGPARRRDRRKSPPSLADTGAIAVREDTNLEPAFWGQFPGQRAVPRAPGDDLDRQHGELRLAPRLRARQGDRQPLGRCASALLETTSATPFFFNFHHGDLGNFTGHRPVGLGQDRGAQLPRRAGAEVRAAHDPVRQGPRRRAVHPRHRRALRPHPRRRADRVQPARAARHRDQPRVPARLARRAAQGRWARGAGDDRRRGRRRLRQRRLRLRRLRFFRELLSGARRPSRATSPTACTRGSTAASTPGCSTTPADRLDLSTRRHGLRHDRAARQPAAAHPDDDVPVPPHRRAARRPADDDPRSTKAGRRSTTRSSPRASATGSRRCASATRWSASPPSRRATRSTAASRPRWSSRPRR